MGGSLRAYRTTVIVVCLLAALGGGMYAATLSIPARVAAPVLAAILLELALYLAVGFDGVRERLSRWSGARLAAAMTASAVAPYLICTVPLGLFSGAAFAALLAMAAALSFWWVVLPRRRALDVAFLALFAAPVVLRAFAHIYPAAAPKLRLDFLGYPLMWARLGIASALLIGRVELAGGFRWLPTRKDWAIGLRHFAYCAPVALALALALRYVRLEPPHAKWYVVLGAAAATFAGMLWVVAAVEEFFFRGLLQEWVTRWTSREWAGLLVASALFGSAHLAFREFPNWRFALLAAVAGMFYGRAFNQARSIRAAMIAHALVNTVWRVFFR